MLNKKIYIMVGLVALTSLVAFILYKNYKLLTDQENKNNSVEERVQNTENYKNAVQLLREGKYEEASTTFALLETATTSMNNMAQLRLKKLQLALDQKNREEALSILQNILSNPNFPNSIKSRAMENVFTDFRGSGDDESYYNLIFSTPPIASLKASDKQASLFNYVKHSYDMYPTTVLGANVIYRWAEKIGNKPSNEEKIALEKFITDFFISSDKEIKNLKKYPSQEIALINIHSERSRVIKKITRRDLKVDISYTMDEELSQALRIAQKLNDSFYLFYASYNYIDYIISQNKQIAPEFVDFLANPEIFSREKISNNWYELVVGKSKVWTPEIKKRTKEINNGLYLLVESHQ